MSARLRTARRSSRRTDGHLHAGGELQRPGQLHLHGERRPRRQRDRHGDGHRDGRSTTRRWRATTRRRRPRTRRSPSRCWPTTADVDGDTLTVSACRARRRTARRSRCDGTDHLHAARRTTTAPDSFTYTVSDGNGGTATGTVTVTVTRCNDAPVGGRRCGDDDRGHAGQRRRCSANDSDLDGDTLVGQRREHAGARHRDVNADGTITYTPAANYNGPDSFTYTVERRPRRQRDRHRHGDGDGGQRRARGGRRRGDDGRGHGGQRRGARERHAISTATRSSISRREHAGARHGGRSTRTGRCTYTPTANYNGPDSFTYTVGDGNGGTRRRRSR